MLQFCINCALFSKQKAIEMSCIKAADYSDCNWDDDCYEIHENPYPYGIQQSYYYNYDCDRDSTPGNQYFSDYLKCPACLFHKCKFSNNNAQDKVNALISSNIPKFILPPLIEDKINDENSKILFNIKRYTLYLLMLEKMKKQYDRSDEIISLYNPDIVTICSLFFHIKSKLLFINNPDIFNIVCEFIGSEYEQSRDFTAFEWAIKKYDFVLFGDNMDLYFLDLFNKK